MATALAVVALAVAAMVAPSSPTRGAGIALTSAGVSDARGATVSADGRWAVFGGLDGERRTVFRSDVTTGEVTELSPVPESVRDGNTVLPRLSADGCVVVAITEIAYDLFRDDDRDERWDVYRLVMPECGGQPNSWELVSIDPRRGTAMDSVYTDDPPAMSGAGGLIAFTHRRAGAPEGVATISLVDMTVTSREPGRIVSVAGMPVEAPGGAYRYRGARQPVLSQNGRHLAFTSDATASAALPGWGSGPDLGGPATTQVYVWDRSAPGVDGGIVHLVSGRSGEPAAEGAHSPALSDDGRVVAFVSAGRTLVPAVLPSCEPMCPTQVYRLDRDPDGNGVFDEPTPEPALALVSAVDAGRVDRGVPVAGNDASWAPALNADGSQVAFVTDATNLLPSSRGGGGGVDDGDLLVAEYALGAMRRVLNDPDLTGVPGAHGRPALSATGQVIVFDSVSAGPLASARRLGTSSGRSVVVATAVPRLALAELDFGTVMTGFESSELYATVLNAGPAAFAPTSVTASSNFTVTGGTCTRGIIVAAGTSCTVNVTFKPTEPLEYTGTLTVAGDGPEGPSVSTTLHGTAGEPALLPNPGGVDLPEGVVGTPGALISIDIDNVGFAPVQIASLELGGSNPGDFEIVSESCSDRYVNPDASCTVEVQATPRDSGYRSALVVATTVRGAYTAAVVGAYARFAPELSVGRPDDVNAGFRPGDEIAIGGRGFPPSGEVTIAFGDGTPSFATVVASDDGELVAIVRLPGRLRAGDRQLVATGTGGAIASTSITVVGQSGSRSVSVPGFGLG